MAGRRSGSDDEGLARRRKKEEPQQQQQQDQSQESKKESATPEQDVYGNSFMVDNMKVNSDRGSDGVPGGGAEVEQLGGHGYGGIDDGGGPPKRPPPPDHWFRPRLRKKKDEDVERVDDEPEEPGIPEEDGDWLDTLEPVGEAWADPAPQPPARALDGGLMNWLYALFPLAGPRGAQFAIGKAVHGDKELQDATGNPLLGVAAAATLGACVAHRAGSTANGRTRLNRGLAIAAAPEAPRDPSKTALQLSLLEAEPGAVPQAPEDRWLARLVSLRLGLDRPPIPELSDPPPAEAPADDDEPVDLDAVFLQELGAPPDPAEALRAAALDGCESQARWAVQLRAACAGIARSLAGAGVDEGSLVSVLMRVDAEVTKATGLLQEIAGAARAATVPVRGLRNGLSRGARVLAGAHRIALSGLVGCAAIGGAYGVAPEPTHEDLAAALRDGRPLPDQDVDRIVEHQLLVDALIALSERVPDAAIEAGRTLYGRAAARHDGVGCATGILLQLEALRGDGQHQAASELRDEAGRALLGANARAGLSLLARWRAAA